MTDLRGNTDKALDLSQVLDLIINDLTDTNAHTLARLIEWHYRGIGNDQVMTAAYKAASSVIFWDGSDA